MTENIKKISNILLNFLDNPNYTNEDLIPLLRNTFLEYTNNDIDENTMTDLFTTHIEASSTKELCKGENREKIVENTLNQYISLKDEDYLIVKNHLLILSKYDKIIVRDEKKYFFLMDILFTNYMLHEEAIETYNKLKKQNDIDLSGVALSRSTTPKAIISKQHNSVKISLKSMPENKELKYRNLMYDEYQKNPHSIDTILHTVNILGGIKSLSAEENQYILNTRKVINSSLPITKKDIYKSANILISLFFHKNSFWIKTINPKYKISTNKLIEINEVLMQYIFDTKNLLNKNNLKQPVQVKTNFDNISLYEFQNKKNTKIHPMFENTKENQELFDDFLEFFKGKIPLK